MNRYMTLDEELARIKEMHNKSVIIELGDKNKKPIDGDELKKGQEIITSDEESQEHIKAMIGDQKFINDNPSEENSK